MANEKHPKSSNPSNVARDLEQLGRNEADPFEIEFLPEFEKDRGSREAYINEYDVIIGDHEYESPHSPLQQWTEETDPSVMAGDQWVHPFKDIGFQTEENRDYFEQGKNPKEARFMHPDKDVAYEMNLENVDGEPNDEPYDESNHTDHEDSK